MLFLCFFYGVPMSSYSGSIFFYGFPMFFYGFRMVILRSISMVGLSGQVDSTFQEDVAKRFHRKGHLKADLVGKSWENVGTSRENHGKTWENHGKIMGKGRNIMEKGRKIIAKSLEDVKR